MEITRNSRKLILCCFLFITNKKEGTNMSKRTLLLVLALIVSVAIAATGTLAYLTATDSDVNVMTLGNVKIEQLEKQRTDAFKSSDEGGHSGRLETDDLEDFVDDKPLYPAYPAGGDSSYDTDTANPIYWGDNVTAADAADSLWDDEKLVGVVDKMVFVQNTGSSPAYYRTILAFECPEGVEYSEDATKELVMNISDDTLFQWGDHGYTTLEDGQRYLVLSATWQQALEPGEICSPSLLQVVMTHNADSSDVAALGDTYEIIAVTQAVQVDNLPDANTALDAGFPDVKANMAQWLNDALDADAADHWDGSVDTSWYNDTDTEFTITTAEQLAGLGKLVDEGNTFEGKTIKLGKDLCLGNNCDTCAKNDEEPLSFDPIGFGYDTVFSGTFDGQNHTIENLYQNGWALGLIYGTQGGGLFASVKDATIENLTILNPEIVMECVDMGVLVGYSYGDCTYRNITVKGGVIANYNRYTGGVVGEINGTQTFENVDVIGTKVSALWGTPDCSCGGIIGGKWGAASVTMKDCDVSAELDVFNDACANYQYYLYRLSGMLIGNSEEETGGTATASYLTATNCTVTYGNWVNYKYCEFEANGSGSYAAEGEWKCSRVQEGYATEGVDPDHTHDTDEDHEVQHTFDQLFGGDKGIAGGKTHDGVTVNYNN